MKTRIFNSLLLAVFMIVGLACSKEGSEGAKGDTGDQGIQGIQGIPGKDGAVILFGNGAPVETLGNNGDMYLDRESSELYGPKTQTGWVYHYY